MKKIGYILILILGLTSCLKDEDLIKTEGPEEGVSTLVMNEIMSNDVNGNPDWIEIYNGGSEAIDLEGYKLNDAENPENGWTIPAGNTVEAGGFIVFNENEWDFGGVSSSGEWVSFADAAGTLIDKIYVPSMSSDAGLTYGRLVDGGDEWDIMSPTPNAPNSNENNPPTISSDPIDSETFLYDGEDAGDNEVAGSFTFKASVSDPDGVAFVKLWLSINGTLSLQEMIFNGSEYQYTIDLVNDDIVFYYIYADDATGLRSHFPETAPAETAYFIVKGVWMDAPEFTNFNVSNANPALTDNVTITFDYKWMLEVLSDADARIYYSINGGDYTKNNKLKVATLVSGTLDNGSWSMTFLVNTIVDAQNADAPIKSGDTFRYYIRMEDSKGEHYFVSGEEQDEADLKADPSTWDLITVQ